MVPKATLLGKRIGYKPGDWLPSGKMGERAHPGIGPLAEAVISALSVGQIHSLMNPSYSDLKDRGQTGNPADIQESRDALQKALLVELGVSGVIGYAFGSWTPGLVGGGIGLLLYMLGNSALDSGLRDYTAKRGEVAA
jgi:hypothetical protein